MANRERGELTLVAGGVTYTLQLTTNSCCEIEDFTGGRTSDDVIRGVNAGSFKDARLLLWMALRTHHRDLATDSSECLAAIGAVIDAAGGRRTVLERLRLLMEINADTGVRAGGAARPQMAHLERIGVSSTRTH